MKNLKKSQMLFNFCFLRKLLPSLCLVIDGNNLMVAERSGLLKYDYIITKLLSYIYLEKWFIRGLQGPAKQEIILRDCPAKQLSPFFLPTYFCSKYQPSGAGGTRSPSARSEMAARRPQNGSRVLERGLTLGYRAL